MQNPIGVDFEEQPGRASNIWETQMLSSDITTTFWPQYFGLPSPKNLWQIYASARPQIYPFPICFWLGLLWWH